MWARFSSNRANIPPRRNISSSDGLVRIVLIGAPGSGKGTQAKKIVRDHRLTQISTGDLLRQEMACGSEVGVRVEAIVNAGELVDDETIFDIVKGKLENCDRFVLDGYPRTLAQAKQVSEFLKEIGKPLQAALYLDVSEDALYERITNRRVHLPSGRVYHLTYNPPKQEGMDDETGEKLVHRHDDTAEHFRSRLKTFHSLTEPLLKFYENDRNLFKIPSPSSDEGYEHIKALFASPDWKKSSSKL